MSANFARLSHAALYFRAHTRARAELEAIHVLWPPVVFAVMARRGCDLTVPADVARTSGCVPMNIHLRIAEKLLAELRKDLSRRHEYALERVAFLSCRPATLPGNGLLLVAHAIHPVADDDYEPNDEVGAMLRGAAFRKALQYAHNNPVSMFHVHCHEHEGYPAFSKTDLSESAKFVPDFWKVRPAHPHGAIVLSINSASGLVWLERRKAPTPISKFTAVGRVMREVEYAPLK